MTADGRLPMLARQLASIAILPFTVTVVVPLWISRAEGIGIEPPRGTADVMLVAFGSAAGVTGLILFAWSVRLFWTRGKGTLAPWDPPRRFVAEGPYRYVRNPMISGVFLILAAEALIVRSWPLAEWAGAFAALNGIYIPLVEEPLLAARFGRSYAEYRRHVPRFRPRLTPWMGPER